MPCRAGDVTGGRSLWKCHSRRGGRGGEMFHTFTVSGHDSGQ